MCSMSEFKSGRVVQFSRSSTVQICVQVHRMCNNVTHNGGGKGSVSVRVPGLVVEASS